METTANAKAIKKHPYKKKDYIKTNALMNFKEDRDLKYADLAKMACEPDYKVRKWCQNGRVPKQVLDRLGIKARNRVTHADNENHPKGGSLYACYVGAEHRKVFETFCKSLSISAKFVL